VNDVLFWLGLALAVIVIAFSAPFVYSIFDLVLPSFSDPTVKILISVMLPAFTLLFFYYYIMR